MTRSGPVQILTPNRSAILIDLPVALLAVLLTLYDLSLGQRASSPNHPYHTYYDDAGIQAILVIAAATNLVLVGALFALWLLEEDSPDVAAVVAVVVVACAALAAAFPWVELVYGASFYSGEVRDKQGLPGTVANGGPFGTIVFGAYLALRLSIPLRAKWIAWSLRAFAVLALHFGHRTALRLLDAPLKLFQS